MRYCLLIMDGAAGLPLPEYAGMTSLEAARTPNLDAMVGTGETGLVQTVPGGLEPDSAVACMSLMGYDPAAYYSGRAPIEAASLGVPIEAGEVVFRCNFVTVRGGRMLSHSAGYISSQEARQLVTALNEKLGADGIRIYPGVGYRNLLKLRGMPESVRAKCTPPHDIPGREVSGYLPHGPGSRALLDLMERAAEVLVDHPVNRSRVAWGELPATGVWLFWGSGQVRPMPSFDTVFGKRLAVTSAVSLLKGLGRMAGADLIEIPGVTDGLSNDFDAQACGALAALEEHDVVVIHIEAPDEAGHSGSAADKISAIERIDAAVVGRMACWHGDDLRVLVAPDHPTPVTLRTHTADAVPFLLWGTGLKANGGRRLTESEAKKTGLMVDPGRLIMKRLIGV